MKKYWVFGILLIGMIVISCVLYPYLPEKIPVHWNLQGAIDSYSGRWFIFFPIGLYLLMAQLFPILRRIDPKRSNYARFEGTYDSFIIMLLLFLFSLWVITCIASFYPESVNIYMILSLLIGILFVVFGNLMPKLKINYMIGFKTPWTLSNETVWLKTHQLAGKLWFAGGFVMMAGSLLPVSSQLALLYLLGCASLITLIPCIYSYVIFKRIRHS